MSFSGNFWMMENNKSSSLLCILWKNSFNLLRSLSSMFIGITPLNFYVDWKIQCVFTKSIGQSGEKDNRTY